MRRNVMIMIETRHIEIDHSRDIESECLVDHVECDAALNLAWVFQESFLINVGRKEVILKLRGDRKLDILPWLAEPLNRLIKLLLRFAQCREVFFQSLSVTARNPRHQSFCFFERTVKNALLMSQQSLLCFGIGLGEERFKQNSRRLNRHDR